MHVEFTRSYTGRSIIGGLQILCRRLGGSLDHTAVSVYHHGSPDSEDGRYTRIRAHLGEEVIEVQDPDGRPYLVDEGKYPSITIVPPPRGNESFEGLEEAILEHLSTPPPEPLNGAVEREVEYMAEPRDLSVGMRVLVVVQGEYGKRILEWISRNSPPDWEVLEVSIPKELPEIIDDPAPYLPEGVPDADLVLFLSENRNSPQLAPDLVRASGAMAIIAPVDRSDWMPPGQVTQLKRIFSRWKVDTSFPRPFCSLEATGAQAIDRFAGSFGKPKVEILSEDRKTVSEVKVIRGSPCGCTHYVAGNLAGEDLESAVEKAGLLHHHFPCLASMDREDDLDDTLMHVSGLILKRETEKGVRKHVKRKISYLDPRQFKR